MDRFIVFRRWCQRATASINNAHRAESALLRGPRTRRQRPARRESISFPTPRGRRLRAPPSPPPPQRGAPQGRSSPRIRRIEQLLAGLGVATAAATQGPHGPSAISACGPGEPAISRSAIEPAAEGHAGRR